jgi:DNA end-binding protein Ku
MWTGFLSFGLVNVPVGLFSASTDQTVHFNQLHKGTSNRVRYKKVDEETGEELQADDIVNGYPVGDSEYIVVTRDELKEAAPGKSDTIEISDFVDLDEIDPVYFRQTYFLGPRGKGADRAYALLRQAMRETNKVGIATLVLRDKEHLVAVRPGEKVLLLETMYFADEIRDPSGELDQLPAELDADARELTVAKQLINSLVADWQPENYRNTYRERIAALIEQKREGHAIVFESDRPKSNVVDLMAALEASVARIGSLAESDHQSISPASTKAAATGQQRNDQLHEQQSFAGMSKAELMSRAADLALPGRSKMSKLELVKALTEADAPKQRRSAS